MKVGLLVTPETRWYYTIFPLSTSKILTHQATAEQLVIIFMQGVRTSVCPSQKQYTCEDNEHLLAVAWWVTINSPGLVSFSYGKLQETARQSLPRKKDVSWTTKMFFFATKQSYVSQTRALKSKSELSSFQRGKNLWDFY